MESTTERRNRLTPLLGGTVIVLLLVLVLCLALAFPHFSKGPASSWTEPPTQAPTAPPTEVPTEPPEPTAPPPDPNPYGPLDFQFEDRYLHLMEGECLTAIDVSAHQKDVDWQAVKDSGVDFAMIRVAYRGYGSGKIVTDPYAIQNLTGAREAGLDVGVYFFSQALTPEEAEEEAYYLLDIISDYEINMPVVYDWEHVRDETARTANMNDKRILTDCTRVFLETVEQAGYWPMVYFNRNQGKKLLDLGELKEYDFWLAAYTYRMDYPYKIQMWQYTNEGKVPGVEGSCDINVFFPETLNRREHPSPTPPTEPPTEGPTEEPTAPETT